MMRRRYPDKDIEELDLDTREGSAKASTYGITKYSALLITAVDGRMKGMWEGEP